MYSCRGREAILISSVPYDPLNTVLTYFCSLASLRSHCVKYDSLGSKKKIFILKWTRITDHILQVQSAPNSSELSNNVKYRIWKLFFFNVAVELEPANMIKTKKKDPESWIRVKPANADTDTAYYVTWIWVRYWSSRQHHKISTAAAWINEPAFAALVSSINRFCTTH